MTGNKRRLLLIEDDKVDQLAFRRFAENNDFTFDYDIVGSIGEAEKLLKSASYDVIVSDYFLGDGTAFDILNNLTDTPMVITTGTGDEVVAVKAMKLGAYDYLIKDVSGYYLKMLPVTVENAINRFSAEKEIKEYHENLEKLVGERTAKLKQEIVEHKKAKDDLKEALEKAEESDRLKSSFLANMSHEIRTPMNGILGFSELLKEPGLSGEEQQEYIKVIESSGERMLNTINNLIEISKLEVSQVSVLQSKVSLSKQFDDICRFFRPEPEKKGLQLLCRDILPDCDNVLHTDGDKLYGILINLVKNAIKYTKEGFIEIGCQRKEKNIEFFVKDSGIGIPKDRQQTIFDRFVQADQTQARLFEGSGLGLSISKAYVELLGGEIWVESEDGKGSVFYFTIPCGDGE